MQQILTGTYRQYWQELATQTVPDGLAAFSHLWK